MRKVLTPALRARVERSVAEFPELIGTQLTVGLTRSCAGIAEAAEMVIRLNVPRRRQVSHFTIGHELTHLLQSGGLRLVPDGEIQCDVWTLARGDLFLDDAPAYLCNRLWSRSNWSDHANTVRALCIQAIDLRKTHRRYLAWLRAAIARQVRG